MSVYIKNTSFKSPDQRITNLEKLNYYLSGSDLKKIKQCYLNLDQRDRSFLRNQFASDPSNKPFSERLRALPNRRQIINERVSSLRNQMIGSPNPFNGFGERAEEGHQEMVVSCLDPLSQTRAAQVCHAWRSNRAIQEVQLSAEARLHYQSRLDDTHAQLLNYPPNMIRFYRNRNSIRLARLPMADVSPGYVSKQAMTSPVMRFTAEPFRPGFAMHIQSRTEPNKNTVVHAFKYRSDKRDRTWVLDGHSDLRDVFRLRHAPHCTSTSKWGNGYVVMCCPTCPAEAGRYRDLLTDEDLSGILSDQDPDFKLVSKHFPVEEKKN